MQMFRARAASIRLSSGTDPNRALALALLLGVSACHAAPRPIVVAGPPPASGVVRLQQDIQAILGRPELERSFWGLGVASLRTGETLYTLNAGRLLMPGSTMKILTLAAAAERLGWDHAFDTRVFGVGPIASGVLSGDLVVVGSGDPSMLDADGTLIFDALADSLKSQGIHSITGRIIGDDNAFDDEALGPGWAWDDLAGRDAAPISGLQYNENTLQAVLEAGLDVGEAATVRLAPAGHLYVDNQVLTSPAESAPSITARRSPGSDRLELRGEIPLGSAPIVRAVSVDNPTLFFATALRDRLTASGIEVAGPSVDIDDLAGAPASADAALLWTHRSPPLSALATRLMKDSQNLYAETLLKAIGSAAGRPTFEGGRMAAGETLMPWGLPPAGLVQVDGSGLSRYNYLTAETLVAVLTHVYLDERLRGPFEASLPIAGLDGTLAARMRGTAAEGNARAKSGTLANVRSLAGYVTSWDGEPLVFAIIANNFGTMPEVAIAAIDAIVVKLAEFRR
jgi:D-alanyl-D-alanine carboxypeptidase/D-alanyl-D-alanine-endopeptidase (penicillin-binding protein 4)